MSCLENEDTETIEHRENGQRNGTAFEKNG
jgi:hypothetical protein